jgi:hypothetical protein
MSFTYNITTLATSNLSRVRFEIGDTTEGHGILPAEENFQDEEINQILDEQDDSVILSAVSLLRIAATKWAVLYDIEVGSRRDWLSQVAKSLQRRADDLLNRSDEYSGATSIPLGRDDGYDENYTSLSSGEYSEI